MKTVTTKIDNGSGIKTECVFTVLLFVLLTDV